MKQHGKKSIKWLFVLLVLMISAVVFATTCWEIDWPLCDEFFIGGVVHDSCTDKCYSVFSSCGDGYVDYEIPVPVCAESGYWTVDEYGLPVLCADRYACDETDVLCDDWGIDEYWCKQGEWESWVITVGYYGINDSCGEE